MTPLRSPVAAPHADRLKPPLHRVGALVWWRFKDAATALPKLAASARRTDLPALFLPVPFPVSHSVAFQRALRRATASVPVKVGGQWTADGVPAGTRTPVAVLRSLGLDPRRLGVATRKDPAAGAVLIAQVEELDGETPERPWVTRLVCVLDLGTGTLRLAEVSAAAGTRRLELMAARLRRMYQQERTLATYPEIGDGIVDALTDAGGVKLRPGLWSVPGQAGIERAEAVVEYLRAIGSTVAGMMDLYDENRGGPVREGLVQLALHEEIEALGAELEAADLEAMQTGALRTLWGRIGSLDERIRANRDVLGRGVGELLREVEPLRERVRQVADRKEVELERRARPSQVRRLRRALEALRRAGRARDPAALETVRPLLGPARAAALAGGFAPLLRRLQKLADAAAYLDKAPLYRALEEAAGFVESRARAAYSLDWPEPAPDRRRAAAKMAR